MPGKPPLLNADDIIRRYASNESLKGIAARYRTSYGRIKDLLIGANITLRRHTCSAAQRKACQSGAKALWAKLQTPAQRQAQTAAAHASGHQISLGNKRRWAKMTPQERANLVKPAHDAVRGMKRSLQELVLRAEIKQARKRMTVLESIVAHKLTAYGYSPAPQCAIGPYNCDLAIYPVAVEIFGGGYHGTRKHRLNDPKRVRYLLDAGWHVWILSIQNGHQLTVTATDHLHAFIQLARANPTMVRQYRMIWGTGELLASGCANDDEISLVPAFTSRRNPATGRYETVSR